MLSPALGPPSNSIRSLLFDVFSAAAEWRRAQYTATYSGFEYSSDEGVPSGYFSIITIRDCISGYIGGYDARQCRLRQALED